MRKQSWLLMAALAAVLPACPPEVTVTDSGNPRDTGNPVDTGNDVQNPTDVPGDTGSCTSPMTMCGSVCTNTQTDTHNCGSCGHNCAAGESCAAGTCNQPPCATGETRCSGVCVDTTSDTANCGTCGHACTSGQNCTASVCVTACALPSMVCTVSGVSQCIDVTTDSNNCGSCGHVCTGGTRCLASACACPTGQTSCSGTCIDTTSDPTNCGTCGHACGTGQVCNAGTCGCTSPLTLCGSACTLTSVDTSNCGTCGHACTAGQSCSSGTCVATACPTPGQIPCSGTCTNPQTDNANCGTCGTACGTGTSCAGGVCRPSNDLRTNAIAITFTAGEATITGSTTNALRDGPATVPCGCTSSGNVWYSFTLTGDEVVYFDTAYTGWDTSLFITNSTGVLLQGNAASGSPADGFCNDDAGCAALPLSAHNFTSIRESRTAAFLSAGTYYLAVGGCTTGNFTLHAQHIQRSIGSYFYTARISGTSTATTSLVNASAHTGTCGGTASGEDVRWFTTCGAQQQFFSLCQSDGGTFTRSNGTTNWDPSMYIYSAQTGAEVTCNDDGGTAGGTNCAGTGGDTAQYGSRINNIVAPRGLNAEFVDERSGGSGMNYTVVYTVR